MLARAAVLTATAALTAGVAFGPGVVAGTAGALAPETPSAGHVSRSTQVIKGQCHAYAYTYDLTPASSDWIFELFVVDPKGHSVASDGFASGNDPVRARQKFTLCRPLTQPGRYLVRDKLTLDPGKGQTVLWVRHGVLRLKARHHR